MKTYIIEKNIVIPLCCVIDKEYVNFFNGQVIENEKIIKFIKNGLKTKYLTVKKMDFVIYKIINKSNLKIIAYNYVINGYSNFLDINKRIINNDKRQHIINKLHEDNYKQEVVWK